jgi:RimJ/RimL family protein N-acetyltransferase
MITKEDLIFRQVVTLRDGARVLIRPLTPDDKQALLDLFLPVAQEERRFMRHNINDPEIVSNWALNPDYERIFPLVALVGERIVGNATLHFGQGPARHRAEMRIFLAKDFRRRGLGVKLIQALIEIAKRRSLYLLEVQTVSDLVHDIKAMQKAGFEIKTTFDDYFILPDGELRDVVHLIMRLRQSEDEF